VTRLRKLMQDELQRRNYAQNTIRTYIHPYRTSRSTSIVRRTVSVPSTPASTRFIYFETASYRQARSKVALPPCGFSM
jgi:hypothetical protein